MDKHTERPSPPLRPEREVMPETTGKIGDVARPLTVFERLANMTLVRRLLVEVLDRPDLTTDPAFATRKARTANKEKLRSILTEIFAGDSRENWIAKMKAVNVPVGYLRTIEEAFNAPEMRERNRVSEIPHPTAGSVPNIEPPIGLSLTPTIDPVAAPLLGQHTKDVLRNTLGYDDDRISELTKAGVFGAL